MHSATALLSTSPSSSATPISCSSRSSRHEWTIAMVMIAATSPGVGSHTPTTSGSKIAGFCSQVCDMGETVDGSVAAIASIAPHCIWSTCACLQPSHLIAISCASLDSPPVVDAGVVSASPFICQGSPFTNAPRAPVCHGRVARVPQATFP